MKNKSLVFSVIGSTMLIVLAFIINYTTSMNHPWFIYPAFAVLWWPLGVFFGQNKKYRAFSVVGGLLIAVFAYIVNMVTSPGFPWFIFPVFAVLWWPMTMLINPSKRPKMYSVLASICIIAFFWLTNYITTPNTIWFIYPAFAVLWWPISMIICSAKEYKLYSVVSTIYITTFLALVNYVASPQYVWFYYPLYGLLWWPMSMFLAKKPKIYSIVMSLLTLGYLALINYMNTPSDLWYTYSAFHLIWWPLVMILGKRAKSFWFALIGALSIIAYYVFLYYRLTPGTHPWYLYIILPAIWWPICASLKRKALTITFVLLSIVVFVAYYSLLNILLTPQHFWAINLVYPALWVVMGVYFGGNRKFFALSVCASIVTIVYFSILNYLHTPNVIWAVYPAFVILWWPLSMYFFKVKKERPQKAAN